MTWLQPIPDCIPHCLRCRDKWVLWRGEVRDDDTPTKVPYSIRYPDRRASVTDPWTWGRFDDAVDAQSCGELQIDGIGYVLTASDGLVGIDLDKCRDPETGIIATRALDIVRRLNSYTELSPSRRGLRIFAHGALPPGGRNRAGVEMYDRGRFLTLTGHRVHGGIP